MSASTKPAAAGGNATWSAQAASTDWNTAANWSPASVPTGTATLGATSKASITFIGSSATVQEIVFSAQAPAYTLTFTDSDPNTPALTISGAGCSNAGTASQQIVVAATALKFTQAQIKFTGAASAGGPNITYRVGPVNPTAHGGGAIEFCDTSTAGKANFVVLTGSGPRQKGKDSGLPGGEVGFSDKSNAGQATFTTYGTTGTDGDTFGNVVFHISSSAAQATFANMGGTASGGDGGNSQFYDNATADGAVFNNYGGTVAKANGGDVAFDGTANAGKAVVHNYAATASGGYGGVVSFNNNAPSIPANQGATAENATIHNYGAKAAAQGGGHTAFSGIFGSGTAGKATIINHGSAVSGSASSVSGHTTFSVQTPQTALYVPSADHATIFNLASAASGAPGGITTFTNYGFKNSLPVGPNGPTAGNATIFSIGAVISGAGGGATVFARWSNAGNAMLLAYGGQFGGKGGSITFQDYASGGAAAVGLTGNATLDISGVIGSALTIEQLSVYDGTVITSVGTPTICLAISSQLSISGGALNFQFSGTVTPGQAYTVLTAPNLASYTAKQFTGNAIGGNAARFSISGNTVQVTFGGSGGSTKKSRAVKAAKKVVKKVVKTVARNLAKKPAKNKTVRRRKA